MSKRIFLLPIWLRLWHWTNATLMLTLIATGISLHYASPQAALIPFSLARDLHNMAGSLLIGAYGFYVVANVVTGNWWQYVPKPENFLARMWLQVRYYVWGIFWGAPHPFPITVESRFNPLQQVIYWSVMYLLIPALLLTGIIFLMPELAPDRLFGYDGLLPIAVAHYSLGFLVTLFLMGHIYLATTGHTPTALIRTMITGYHEEH